MWQIEISLNVIYFDSDTQKIETWFIQVFSLSQHIIIFLTENQCQCWFIMFWLLVSNRNYILPGLTDVYYNKTIDALTTSGWRWWLYCVISILSNIYHCSLTQQQYWWHRKKDRKLICKLIRLTKCFLGSQKVLWVWDTISLLWHRKF